MKVNRKRKAIDDFGDPMEIDKEVAILDKKIIAIEKKINQLNQFAPPVSKKKKTNNIKIIPEQNNIIPSTIMNNDNHAYVNINNNNIQPSEEIKNVEKEQNNRKVRKTKKKEKNIEIQQPLPKEETNGNEKKPLTPPVEHSKLEIKENKKSPNTDVPKSTTKRSSIIKKNTKTTALIPIPPPSEEEVLARRQRRVNQRNDLFHKSSNENNLNDLFYLIVWDLMGYEYCWPFYYPVDPQALGVNDYLEKIKIPMDLTTIKEKITNQQYPNSSSFCNDVRLVFQNAMDYNSPESDISNSANSLLQTFEKMAKKLMDIENKSKLQLKIELEGKVKDHSEIVNNLKREEIVLQDQKKKVDEENNIPGPRALSKISSLPPLDYSQKKKIYDIFTNFPDKYKRGLNKIIENDLKDKERIKRATKETEDDVLIEIDAFDKITMRRIEAYVKDCCERENIEFSIANNSPKDGTKSPDKTLEASDKKISPPPNVKEPTTPLKDDKKPEAKENATTGEKTGENKEEESSSSSSEVSSNDSSDSDSSEDSENGAGNLIIDQQNNNANKGQVKT